MIKLKNKKTFIYTKNAGYINILHIVRFYTYGYNSSMSYHIDVCNTINTAHSASVVSYEISKDEYKKLEDMFKE